MSKVLVNCENVWKRFRRHTEPKLLRDYFRIGLKRAESAHIYALADISFQLSSGEGLAIVGANGAGKTTLLSVLAGLAKPDLGLLTVGGTVVPLFELGSGFHPDLSGAENFFLNCALLGFSEARSKAIFEPVLDFSELRDFINEPLRTYSTGMILRLAFSVVINLAPDVLLIDEVLAVGDASFQRKCIEQIRKLRAAGQTLVCVAHSRSLLQQLCERAIWLHHGKLVMSGSLDEVHEAYETSCNSC